MEYPSQPASEIAAAAGFDGGASLGHLLVLLLLSECYVGDDGRDVGIRYGLVSVEPFSGVAAYGTQDEWHRRVRPRHPNWHVVCL